jgi:hypothetical protein
MSTANKACRFRAIRSKGLIMNENAWFLFATRDGVAAQLGAARLIQSDRPRATTAPDSRTSVAHVTTAPRRSTQLFRRFRTA